MITLGIDCGTQSTKTIALDTDTGRIIASAAQVYDVLPGLPPGHLEQNPATWTDAVDTTIRQVVEKLGARRSEVRGIGASGQQHGFVPLDKEGRVIGCGRNSFAFTGLEEEDVIGQRVEQVLGLAFNNGDDPVQTVLEWGVRALGVSVEVAGERDVPALAKADIFPAYDDDGGLMLVLTPDK